MGSKYTFDMQCKLIKWFLFATDFYRTVFPNSLFKSEFNSNNSAYIFKLHAKNVILNTAKFASVEKIHTKIIMAKRNLELMIWDFSVIQESMSWFAWVYVGSSLYITKTGHWGKSKFWNVHTLFMAKFAVLLCHFGTPFSNGENRVTVKINHAAMAVTDYIEEVYVATKQESDN